MDRAPAPRSAATDLPGLFQLVGGYLHQDWTLDYQNWQEAVDAFVADAAPEDRDAAAADLRRIIDGNAPEPVLRLVAQELDVNVDVEGRGLTYRQWFQEVLSRLTGEGP